MVKCSCSDVAGLADDPRIIFSVYATAFIPLAFIYALDFITAKWRSVRETRRNGCLQLLVSLPSIAYVIYYVILQLSSNDHKEAAAALAVAFFNVYHVLRTVWGLVQLWEFRNWNICALRCLFQLGYSIPIYDYSDNIKETVSQALSWCPLWNDRSAAPFTPPASHSSDSASVIEREHSHLHRVVKSLKNYLMCFYDLVMGNMQEKAPRPWARSEVSLDQIKRTVDYHMVVNSSLIDNEFANAELPVRISTPCLPNHNENGWRSILSLFASSILRSKKLEECSVRWLVSFLARFGHSWLADTRGLSTPETVSPTTFKFIKRKLTQDLAVLASLQTTMGSVEENGSTEHFASLFSPFHRYCVAPSDCRSSCNMVTRESMLPFKMKGSTASKSLSRLFDFSNHEATIKDAANDDWHKTSLNKLPNYERKAVKCMSDVQLACFSTLMDGGLKQTNADYLKRMSSGERGNVEIRWDGDDPRIETLLYQLGHDSDKEYTEFFQELPIRKEFLAFLLWGNNCNRLLLQATAHADNALALESGDRLSLYVDEYFELSRSDAEKSVFQKQYDIETMRLRNEILTDVDKTALVQCQCSRFIGCITETVRSILAEWADQHAHSAVAESGWRPDVAPAGIKFKCSLQLSSLYQEIQHIPKAENAGPVRSLHLRTIWELQSHLQAKLADGTLRQSKDIRQSTYLIMLFVLGFPALKVEDSLHGAYSTPTNSGGTSVAFHDAYTVKPIGGPQEVVIMVNFDEETTALSATLCPEAPSFNWQEWKDAYMGRLCAQKHWRTSRLSSKHEKLREEAKHSAISGAVRTIAAQELGLEYELTYWTGWPPWLPRIAEFEVKKLAKYLSDRTSFYPSYEQSGAKQLTRCVEYLISAIDIYCHSRKEPKLFYAAGTRALSEGREDEALKIFGQCIAVYGCRDALRDSIDLVLKKTTVPATQELSLRTHMNTWFTVLMKRGIKETQRGTTPEIDLEMLAQCFGRLYEKTGNEENLLRKALALFHTRGEQNPVNEAAIEAIESFLICEPDDHTSFHLKFHLAVAHQSHFHQSRDIRQQQLAARYLKGIGTEVCNKDVPFTFSIGYLLEKGCFIGREARRKDALLTLFCPAEGWGDERRIRTMFERLFVKQNIRNGAKCPGIGIRPKYAMEVYKASALGSENEDASFCSALVRLGILYHKGAQGVPPSTSDAEEHYSRAIALGNKDALCNMGVLKSGSEGESVDLEYLRRAATDGSSSGMNNLAIAYELGDELVRDLGEAERLYQMAIDMDRNPIAMYNLAVMYLWACPQHGNIGNITEAKQVLTTLSNTITELAPLYTLQSQVRKLAITIDQESEIFPAWGVKAEEIGDSLAYVKVLQDGSEMWMGPDVQDPGRYS